MPVHTVPPPTKEVWVPATTGTEGYTGGYHTGYRVDASGEAAGIELRVPHDFHGLISIELIVMPLATAAAMYATLSTYYAAVGEAGNNHAETATGTNIGATTANQLKSIDISGLVDAGPLAALDQLCVYLAYSATATATNLVVLGVRLRYT